MASTVYHNGQNVAINDPDSYGKLSYKDKISYLDQQVQQPTQDTPQMTPQTAPQVSQVNSVNGQQMYQANLPTQQPAPVAQNIPTKPMTPNQIPQEQPKPAQPQVPQQDNQKIVSEAYAKYGIEPSSETKKQEHISNIQKGQQTGYYQNTDQAKQDVESAIVKGLGGDQMFNAIRAGGVNDMMKENVNFQGAMQRVNQLNGFINATPDARTALANSIMSGSQQERDLINAGFGDYLTKAKNVSNLNSIVKKENIVQTKDIQQGQSIAQSIISSLSGGLSAVQTYADLTKNSPEYQLKLSQKSDAMAEYTKKKDLYDQVEMDTYDEFKGTGATESYIQNLISQRRRNMLPELNLAQRQYENASSGLSDYMTQVKDQVNLQSQDNQMQMDRAKLASSLYAPTIQYQQQQALQQENLMRTAPSIVSEISQEIVGGLDNPGQWNQRALELAQNGYNQDQIKSQLMGEMQQARKEAGKPFQTYAQAKSQQELQLESQKQSFDQAYKTQQANINLQRLKMDASKVDWKQDPNSGEWKAVSMYAPMTQNGTIQSNFSDKSYNVGEIGGQCGSFCNNINGTPYMYGDTLESKSKWIDSDEPVAGGDIVLNTGAKLNDGRNAGHVAKIKEVLSDGRMVVIDSNLKNDEKVRERIINPNNKEIMGYVSPNTIEGYKVNKSLDVVNTQVSKKNDNTENQAKAYADRMNQAQSALLSLENTFANRSAFGQYFQKNAPNILTDEDEQLRRAQTETFINAMLRKESGAAVPDTEFNRYSRTYFAQPGDTINVIKQKGITRENIIKQMYGQSGYAINGKPFGTIYTPRDINALWGKTQNQTQNVDDLFTKYE